MLCYWLNTCTYLLTSQLGASSSTISAANLKATNLSSSCSLFLCANLTYSWPFQTNYFLEIPFHRTIAQIGSKPPHFSVYTLHTTINHTSVRTTLNVWPAGHRDLYLPTYTKNTVDEKLCLQRDSNPRPQQSSCFRFYTLDCTATRVGTFSYTKYLSLYIAT